MTPNTPETNVDADSLPKQQDRASQFSLDIEEKSLVQSYKDWVIKLRTGQPGALPSIVGLVVLAIVFSQVSSAFLTAGNLWNIPGQGAYIAVIALGLVFVLLLGEIDLSASTAGGTCAAFAAVAIVKGNLHDELPSLLYWALLLGMLGAVALAVWVKAWSAAAVVVLGLVLIVTNLCTHQVLGLLTAICIGAAIGVYNGVMVAKIGIPSFVVTLALFLAWQGVLQFAIKGQQIGLVRYDFWHGLSHSNLTTIQSWIFSLVLALGYVGYTIVRAVRSKAAGLAHEGLDLVLSRGAVLIAAAIVITYLANRNRGNQYKAIAGIPIPAAIAITLMVICTIGLIKTTWGRHLYATGGNAEAARRAGIDVVHMRVTAFTLCSAFGALGGIMLASSQSEVSLDLGTGNVLLFSVAAAVIGGTSLFGGRGKPRDAIIGALVITIIPNGLLLRTSIDPHWQLVITGAVLLAAAAVDALSRKRARNS